jgi:hypothetical protein
MAQTPALASLLSQRNQEQNDSDPGQNHGGGETGGRDFGPGMVVLLQMPGETDQKKKKANTDHYQSNRPLVVGRDFHSQRNQISLPKQNSSALFA